MRRSTWTRAKRQGIVVSGTAGLPYPTAELTIGLILAWARSIALEDRELRDGRFQTTLGRGLNGKTLGIIGLGTLGSRVAKIAIALEMQVLAWSQNLTDERAQAAGATRVEKDELLEARGLRDGARRAERPVAAPDRRARARADEADRVPRQHVAQRDRRRSGVGESAARSTRSAARRWTSIRSSRCRPITRSARRRTRVLTPHLGYVTEETYRIFHDHALEDIEAFLNGQPIRVLNG